MRLAASSLLARCPPYFTAHTHPAHVAPAHHALHPDFLHAHPHAHTHMPIMTRTASHRRLSARVSCRAHVQPIYMNLVRDPASLRASSFYFYRDCVCSQRFDPER